MKNNTVKNVVHGFKVFKSDWTCSPNGHTKQYTCPGNFEEEGKLGICGHGMHFCQTAADCFNYCSFDPNNKVAEVIAYGEVITDGDKSCTNKLMIVREIPWDEVLRIVNIGKKCIGRCNTGDWNVGNYNTGRWDTGECNSGDYNTGDRNTGDWNTGDWNTGNWNTGHCNTGDWNKSSRNTGCFNTESPKIFLFNKPSDWTYQDWLNSDARYLLNQIPKDAVKWVYEKDMTDESERVQLWWNTLSVPEKNIIKSIPNFDGEIFFQCTGINVSESE